MPSCQTPSTNRYTHTDCPSSKPQIHLSTVYYLVSHGCRCSRRIFVCVLLVLKLHEFPPNKSTDRHRTNKTVQHTTKHSYLHPHPQECPPDNKSSVSDQGSCHLVVLILRQKSQSHMSAFRLLWGTWMGMTCHCLQVETLDCP